MIAACGYAAAAIHGRLMQRLVELTLGPYVAVLARRRKAGQPPLPPSGSVVDCASLSLTTGSGHVAISLRQTLSGCAEFIAHWGYVLLSILAGMRPGGDARPATLVLGVGEDNICVNGDDSRFTNYCRSGPILPLKNGTRFLVQSVALRGTLGNPDFAYARHPLMSLLQNGKLGARRRLGLLLAHAVLPFAFFAAVLRLPLLALLGRDFAYTRAVKALDAAGAIEAIVDTCSAYTTQPLWLRGAPSFPTHMVWYAQNWKPMVYAGDDFRSDIPNLRWICVATHWIWTQGFGEYLRSLGVCGAMQVVGPIMWYPPELRQPPPDGIQIMLFDLNPFSDEVAERLGELENYWRPENLRGFVQAVLAASDALSSRFGCAVTVCLKRKRGYSAIYDKGYFDFVDGLVDAGRLAIVPPSDNIFQLVSASHAVVVYPYSSPAYVASHLGVPAVYFDPTGMLQPSHEESPWIDFANSRSALVEALAAAIVRRRNCLAPQADCR